MNPLEELEEHEKRASADRKQHELGLLKTWHEGGKQPEHLAPLLTAYAPLVNQKMRLWKAPTVPEDAFRAELQKHVIRAFESYKPDRGAALSTHVENHIRKAIRYNIQNQNLAYIPEAQVAQISPINRARDQLREDLSRDPTHEEIAQHMGMPVKKVKRILSSQRRDIADSQFESAPDETMRHLARDREVLSLLPHDLNDDEKKVFHHVFGLEGHQQVDSTNQLAKLLGKTSPQVSRIKSSILTKYNKYR
jgi:DNA-directed RNA polymerase specialized sigma subunit